MDDVSSHDIIFISTGIVPSTLNFFVSIKGHPQEFSGETEAVPWRGAGMCSGARLCGPVLELHGSVISSKFSNLTVPVFSFTN